MYVRDRGAGESLELQTAPGAGAAWGRLSVARIGPAGGFRLRAPLRHSGLIRVVPVTSQSPSPDPALMVLAHQGILDVTLALNALLPQVSDHARNAADRAAATTCTALAAELGDCYAARLKTFLNPLGRPPGTASAVIRTQPRRSGPRRGPASGTPAPDPGR